MVVFTSICANYLHKARVLARSVKKYIPDAVFIVCMTERGLTDSMRDDAFDSVVLSKDMWEGDFDAYIFKHAIGCTAHIQRNSSLYIWTRTAAYIPIFPNCGNFL